MQWRGREKAEKGLGNNAASLHDAVLGEAAHRSSGAVEEGSCVRREEGF